MDNRRRIFRLTGYVLLLAGIAWVSYFAARAHTAEHLAAHNAAVIESGESDSHVHIGDSESYRNRALSLRDTASYGYLIAASGFILIVLQTWWASSELKPSSESAGTGD